jgi:hypothetical protein
MVGWILFIFDIQEFICHTDVPASKIGALQMGPKTQNGNFLENGQNDFD